MTDLLIQLEFDQLFEELSGIKPEDADKDKDGFLFIPLEANLGEKPVSKRMRIGELSGPNGWRNHVVDDQYAGWWIRRPV